MPFLPPASIVMFVIVRRPSIGRSWDGGAGELDRHIARAVVADLADGAQHQILAADIFGSRPL
jgi:hypothetical protein